MWAKFEEMFESLSAMELEQRKEEGVAQSEPYLDKDNLLILVKILAERRSPNESLWSLVLENVEELLPSEAFDLKELA